MEFPEEVIDVEIPSQFNFDGVPIYYVDAKEMEGSPYTFCPRKDGKGYNLLKMSEQKFKTATIIMHFEGEINSIANTCKLIAAIKPILNVSYPPRTITSIRGRNPDNKNEIIRRGRDTGGIFENSTIMDIWYKEGENYCSTKFSKHKLIIFGITDYDMACTIGKYFIAHIKDALRFQHLIRDNPVEFQRAIDWIIERSKGEEIENMFLDFDSSECIFEYNYKIRWTWELAPIGESYSEKLVTYFIDEIRRRFMFDTDYITTTNQLKQYMDEIASMPDIINSTFGCKGFQRSMLNYNYIFPFNISRRDLGLYLQDVLPKDYIIDIHNSERTELKVLTYSPVTVDSDEIFRRCGEQVKQTFFFYKDGRVMHSGPGGKSSEDRYYDMVIRLIYIHAQINNYTFQ